MHMHMYECTTLSLDSLSLSKLSTLTEGQGATSVVVFLTARD
jgi:hypothetical protein